MDHIYALPAWAETQPVPPEVRLSLVSEKELRRMSQLTTPNQVLAVVDLPQVPGELPAEMGNGWSLYLDGVQSPSNLGALLRIADWFGFAHVVAGPGTADLYNAKSIQASMGSFLRVHHCTCDLAKITSTFPELTIHGADLRGRNIYEYRAPKNGLLVIGAEGPGISEGARPQVQTWLTIPQAEGRRTESLNAAVAAGILCGALRFGAGK